MPEPPYRALRFSYGWFHYGLHSEACLMIFAEKPLIVRIFLRPPLHAIPYAMWPSWTR